MKSTTLGALIYTARKQKEISQVSLAKALGYEYNPVHMWEQDYRKPTPTELARLKELLSPELNEAAVDFLMETQE